MIKKIRQKFDEIRGKKHYVFDDLDPTIRRCLKHYGQLFPNHRVTKDGSRVAYHFGVEGVGPITLEKEHGSREYLPPYYAKGVIQRIEGLLAYIEGVARDSLESADVDEGESAEPETGATYDGSEKGDAIAQDEGHGLLPRPKLSDGDS
ncbi:MAG TPA: hypothetical protein VH437_12580 [Terriglobales bacterium]|jgi:hypothetical protein